MIKIYYKINGNKYELNRVAIWITLHSFFYRLRTKFKPGGFIQKKIDKIMDYIHNEKIVKGTIYEKSKLIDGLDEVKTEEV